MNGTITSSNKLLHLWQSLFDNVCNVLDFAIRNGDPCLVTEFFCYTSYYYTRLLCWHSKRKFISGSWEYILTPFLQSQTGGMNVLPARRCQPTILNCVKTKTSTWTSTIRPNAFPLAGSHRTSPFILVWQPSEGNKFTHRCTQFVTSQDFVLQLTLVGLQDNYLFVLFILAGYSMGTGLCYAAGKAAEAYTRQFTSIEGFG
jgi:hypothetical protein